MTARAFDRSTTSLVAKPDDHSLHCGGGTDLFSSGSITVETDMRRGGETGLFTTSCAPSGQSMATGDLVELFTTSR